MRQSLTGTFAGIASPRPALLFACAKSNQKAHIGEKTKFSPLCTPLSLTGKSLRRGTSARSLVQASPLILSTRTESSVFSGKYLHYAYSVSVGPDFYFYYAGIVRCCRIRWESRILYPQKLTRSDDRFVGYRVCPVMWVAVVCRIQERDY